jgi:cellulose synthase/poly-beta-1,6-N-acetylglucosamine synthase-like glycosyltransferase
VQPLLHIAFWLGCATLVYTFLGYPILIHTLGKLRRRDLQPSATSRSVSVVLVVRNEAGRLGARIENLLDTDFPKDRLEIVLVDDGSDDETIARAKENDVASLQLIANQSHRGKPAGLNDGVAAARGEIIVFADARQRFERSTIPALVAAFADPDVGAVSGELQIEASQSGAGAGVDAYWRLEKTLRLGESRFDSAIGCTGAVYAILKSAFTPLPENTILDDVVCPMQIALKGKRVLFCPEALAFDPQRLDPANEARRKRRTIAGNFQMLFRYPGWLLPWRNRLLIQLVSHKYLRLIAPALIVAVFSISVILAVRGSAFFLIVTAAQCLFFLLAIFGMANPRIPLKIVTLPAGFIFLNCMTVLGFIEYFKLRGRSGW